jgi:hypothetical protein
MPDAKGFGASLANAVRGETSGIGAALGGTLMTGLKTFAAPLAALAAGLSVKHFVEESTKSFEDLAGSVKSFGRLAGGTTEQVSGLRGAMQLGGVNADQASGAITIFSKNLGNAASDATKAQAMVAKLGTSFLDAAGHVKPMSEILPGVADKFKSMPDGAEKTALAVQLFGRADGPLPQQGICWYLRADGEGQRDGARPRRHVHEVVRRREGLSPQLRCINSGAEGHAWWRARTGDRCGAEHVPQPHDPCYPRGDARAR